jgi:hypothetical protein
MMPSSAADDSHQGRIRLDGVGRGHVSARPIVASGPSPVAIDGCLITRNGGDIGGAIRAWYGFLDVESTTIADNDSVASASLFLENSAIVLRSTIVASRQGGGLITCSGGVPLLDCVVLWASPSAPGACTEGESVLVADPAFCDPDGGDYSLRPDSPCRAGHGPPGCPLIGAYEVGCDAPVPAKPTSWGALKALYR